MRTFLSCFLIALLSFGLLINEASAKRFGGGRSFGVQRSHSSLFSPNKVQRPSMMGQNTQKTKRWGSLLGGMLIGGLLTSLFMGHGLGTGILTWLIIGALGFYIVNALRRKTHPGFQSNSASPLTQKPFHQAFQSNTLGGGSTAFQDYPANFNPDVFLREAKVTFNRLQAAYDQKNLHDLKEFTAPEVFAEIKMQLDERGEHLNQTEVLALDAQLLDVTKQSNSWIASVHFTGSVKENNEISQLDEIWHFRQFSANPQWLVGGIQQDVFQP